MAGNGYGQWTVWRAGDDLINQDTFFALLGNAIYAEESGDQGEYLIPSGQSAYGTSNLPVYDNNTLLSAKVASNLDGRTCYVVPYLQNGLYLDWKIVGLNDERGASQQIDISFTGLPNPRSTREVVDQNAALEMGCTTPVAPNVSCYLGTQIGSIFLGHADWRDAFDNAKDSTYTNIVWEGGLGAQQNSIHVTVIRLSDRTLVAGFPITIDAGSKPTIACNVRNASGNVDFEVAYIKNDQIYTARYTNGQLQTPVACVMAYIDPNTSSPNNYMKALHARIVITSVYGGTSYNRVIYAIVRRTLDHLILYEDPTVYAEYCDGFHLIATPLLPPDNTTQRQVVDGHIIAFPDPYNS
ncbi:MAG: hypothetical protein ACRD4B_07315, partial [Acidobacteriota bacterium]